MTQDASAEILQRLASIETAQNSLVTSSSSVAAEQVKQGNRLSRIETKLETMPSRCANHGDRLGKVEMALVPLRTVPADVRDLRDTQAQRGFLAGFIGSVVTALGFLAKYLISNKGGP